MSPSGASTDPTLHLGAIMGLSYLNSVQLSLSIFILLLIRLVITIPQRHRQTPAPLLHSLMVVNVLSLHLLMTRNLHLKETRMTAKPSAK